MSEIPRHLGQSMFPAGWSQALDAAIAMAVVTSRLVERASSHMHRAGEALLEGDILVSEMPWLTDARIIPAPVQHQF
jgi:hypothetical protein